MDHWFDTWKKVLVRNAPRRRVFATWASGLLAVLAPVPIGDDAAATNRRKKGKKKRKCGKRCIPRSHCCTSSACPPGEVCRNGRCAECTSANDCPTPATCEEAVCQDGRCSTTFQPAGFACEADPSCVVGKTCNGAGQCQDGAPDDGLCPGNQICDPQQGCRCPNALPDPCGDDCIADGAACITGLFGVCAAGTQQCVANQPICVQNVQPSAEVCDGLDNDCDGAIDEGSCPAGQRCEGGTCCKEDGFEAVHACTNDAECCSGNCATHDFGTTCRPAGCLPSGASCVPDCPGACCSFTSSGTTCQ